MLIRRLRLTTGLVLFTYVSTHLLNHALGVISLEAAEAGRLWFTAFWRFAPLSTLLYLSLITHILLAFWALYQRRHFRIPGWEILRLLLGLTIPLLLIQHVFGTRVTHEVLGTRDTYARQMLIYWVLNPGLGIQQVMLLLVAWTHGCLGIHYWLRVKPWHAWTVPALRFLGVLVPLFALLGFVEMGREVAERAADPAWVQAVQQPSPPPIASVIEDWREGMYALFLGSLAATLLAREVRTLVQRRRGLVYLTYPEGQRVGIVHGTTILEASRAAGIPHASVCGGRGRCSTCRTPRRRRARPAPPTAADEARVLRRIGAPPNVRLARQTRPAADAEVFPLLPPVAGLPADPLQPGLATGNERELAILFADLRAFTTLAEQRLPYDVVFLLNQYAAAMGRAIEAAGGHPNQFTGDGIMALFGLENSAATGCRAALHGAVNMGHALERLNRALASDLAEPLRMGIGIHTGHVIVGEMGYGRARYLTAIGDVVNTASRLEALTKDYDCQLVVSEDVAARAGIDLSRFPRHEIQIRGRSAGLQMRAIARVRDLEPLLRDGSDPG